MDKWGRSRLLRVCCCCFFILATLLTAAAIVIIVFAVLLKPKDVRLHVNSITVQELDATINLPAFQPNVTLIMNMDVLVYNPNRASFKFSNSTVDMFYHGDEAARTYVPGGTIPARGSVNISTVLDVDATRVVGNSNFPADVANGTLPVTTASEIRGRVNAWNIIKRRMVSVSRCKILLSITNRTVLEYTCDRRNKF